VHLLEGWRGCGCLEGCIAAVAWGDLESFSGGTEALRTHVYSRRHLAVGKWRSIALGSREVDGRQESKTFGGVLCALYGVV
jgi:hypothetical protein